jgi:hypothetical protein
MMNSQKNLFNADLNSVASDITGFYDYEFRNNSLSVTKLRDFMSYRPISNEKISLTNLTLRQTEV